MPESLSGTWIVLRFSICVLSAFLFVALGFAASQTAPSKNVRDLLEKAKSAGQRGSFDEAARLYREILTIQPGWLPAEFDLAVSYHFAGKYPEAISWFNNAIRLDPSIASAYFLRGIDYYQTNEYQKALASLKRALELQPDHTEARLYLAASYYQLNDFTNAALAYLDQIRAEPRKGDPYFQLVQCYERLEQTALYELEKAPGANYFVLLLEAEKDIEQGNGAAAESQAKLALDVDQAAPEAWFILGKAAQQNGEAERATAQFQHAREAEKNVSPRFRAVIDAALNTLLDCAAAGNFGRSLCRAAGGDISEATALVVAGARSNRRDARALYWSAQVYRRLAQSAMAILAQLSPDSPNLLKLYARAYELKGQRDAAAQAYERAVALDDQDASTLIEYANFSSRGQEFDKAASLLERAVALTPYDIQAQILLGQAYLESGQDERAVDCLSRILKANPQNEAVRLELADALHTLNRLREAVSVLRSAPNDPDGRISYMLATCYARLGKAENARRMMHLFEQRKKRSK